MCFGVPPAIKKIYCGVCQSTKVALPEPHSFLQALEGLVQDKHDVVANGMAQVLWPVSQGAHHLLSLH